MNNFALGGALAGIIALAAWRIRSLSSSGAVAAFIVGTVTFGSLGRSGAAVLLTFFVSSVALSRVGKLRKRALVDIGKTGARDAAQVLANGGCAAICALGAFAVHDSRTASALAAAFAGSYAAAAADTWATEIGTLARQAPRSIINGKPLAAGLSGGVTAAGTSAEACGAALVALIAYAAGIHAWLAIFVAGFAGATIDSLLGATLQDLRWCEPCNRRCETDPHACGTATTSIRGAPWFSNDAVNFAATASGALIAFTLAFAR